MQDLLQLRILTIVPEAPEAVTLVLEERNGQPVPYQAGQFLTFLINLNGRELRRSYSLSSAPGIDPHLAVTIKKVANGEVSRHILTNWRVGDIIVSLPPAGRFTIQPNAGGPRDIFLIGAGSGMTPLFSLLKTLLHQEPQSRITLIDSNKNEHTALFWDQLNQLDAQHANLTCIHLFGDPTPHTKQYQGRLNIGLLEQLVQEHLQFDRSHAAFYVCGPFTFMRMVRMTLTFMRFGEAQIHQENFVVDTLAAAKRPVPEDASPKKVKIIHKGRTYELWVPGNQTILKAALVHDISLPYSCSGGVCAACAGVCTQGTVQMTINEVLTETDLSGGWVLTCVGYPVTDEVIIQIP